MPKPLDSTAPSAASAGLWLPVWALIFEAAEHLQAAKEDAGPEAQEK